MTIHDLLREYLDREKNNVFSYSASWTMTCPKKGYEKEFAKAAEKVELLETHIALMSTED